MILRAMEGRAVTEAREDVLCNSESSDVGDSMKEGSEGPLDPPGDQQTSRLG